MEHHEQDNYSAHAERGVSSARDRDISEALCERVRRQPQIAAYLASERRVSFNQEGIFRRYPELDASVDA